MRGKGFFFVRVLHSIRNSMPPFVFKAIIALLPVTFILTTFEIFGLLSILPVIQILVNPEVLTESKPVYVVYKFMGEPTTLNFVLYLLSLSVIFFVLKNALVYWASLKQTHLVYETASRLTLRQFENYLHQPFNSHVNENSSIVLRRIIEIPYNFTNGILLPIVQFINEIIIAFLIVVGILLYNPVLFISMAMFISPFLILYVSVYKRRLKKISGEREAGHSEMFRKGRQSVDGFREILLFNKFDYFIPLFKGPVYRFSTAMAKIYHLNLFSPKIIETLAIFSVFGIFAVGVFLNYDVAALVSFLATFAIAAYRLIPSVNKIIFAYNNIKSTEFVFEHFRKKDGTSLDVGKGSAALEIPIAFERELRLTNVSFSFHPGKPLLQHVSLSVKKGEMIGIMGKSGSGKSTLINIMLGLFSPTEGCVMIDDSVLNSRFLSSWHRIISFVPQNPILIEGSILENIAFGVSIREVDRIRVELCIEQSGLSDYIKNLPGGVDTFIGDKNLNISGGQKQRLAIARALYHDGTILIFDEATSSLDPETEAELTESIKHLKDQGYTVIIIAHRPETFKYCDWIYAITHGQLSDAKQYSDIYGK